MNTQLAIETAVCEEHQRLFAECERALETWNEHRAEFCVSRLSGNAAGDELVRLQAKYARAYTVLQRHAHACLLCQLVPGAEGLGSVYRSEAHSDNTLYA